jgi:hypothetical protein
MPTCFDRRVRSVEPWYSYSQLLVVSHAFRFSHPMTHSIFEKETRCEGTIRSPVRCATKLIYYAERASSEVQHRLDPTSSNSQPALCEPLVFSTSFKRASDILNQLYTQLSEIPNPPSSLILGLAPSFPTNHETCQLMQFHSLCHRLQQRQSTPLLSPKHRSTRSFIIR